MSVIYLLTLNILQEIHTKSVDFVLAYTQADVKSEIYMEIFLGFLVYVDQPIEWVIKLDKNLYGSKDSDLAWF